MSELKAFYIVVAEEGYGEGIVKYRRAVYDKSEADKVIARHKYKRCLAMAKLCNEKWLVHNFAEIPTKLGFYDKWEKRWLALANKFKDKEAK